MLLHAAGLEISHFLPDKEPREFDLVFDVKSDGWFNLLPAIGDLPLGATVAFSSVAGRFGNGGQTDYSAANDLLCKSVVELPHDAARHARHRHRLDGLGRHRHGHPRLDPEDDGAGRHRHAAAGGRRPGRPPRADGGGAGGEVVVAGAPRAAGRGAGRDRRPRPGAAAAVGRPAGRWSAASPRWRVRRRPASSRPMLDPTEQPFLDDHQIDGTPVLPGRHGHRGASPRSRALLAARAGTSRRSRTSTSSRRSSSTATSRARSSVARHLPMRDGDHLVADCRLVGRRTLPGQPEPQVTTHFTGQVRLARDAPGPRADGAAPVAGRRRPSAPTTIYRVYFHGPAYQVLERRWRDERRRRRRAGRRTCPADHVPADRPLAVPPRA